MTTKDKGLFLLHFETGGLNTSLGEQSNSFPLLFLTIFLAFALVFIRDGWEV